MGESGFGGIGVDPSYLNMTNTVFRDPDFLRGVCKLQKGIPHELTQAEKRAVECLRSGPTVRVEPAEEGEEGGGRFHRALKKRRAQPHEEYIDCNFILATAVGVERLWSLAKNVLTDGSKEYGTIDGASHLISEGEQGIVE